MKLFLSHSSNDKSLVHDVIKHVPAFLDYWIDDTNLVWGEDLAATLKSVIQVESDFVVAFIGRDALNSDWVRREVRWALKQEKELKREFLLPILIEDVGETPAWMRRRLYLNLRGRDKIAVEILGKQISEGLFQLLAKSWDQSIKRTGTAHGNIAMSGVIDCDRVDVIADRRRGPYSQSDWLQKWQERHANGTTEVIVIARTAKWWYEQIREHNVTPSDSLSISILASDPIVDRRLLAAEDRREFSEDLETVLKNFADVSREFEQFEYLLASTLVLDSFTFVKTTTESTSDVLVVLDLYTGARYKGPRPQIAFQHRGSDLKGHDCIVTRLEARARRMLTSGGKDVTDDEAREIAQPFTETEEEPSRRDNAGRLANHAIGVFDFYDSVSNSIATSDAEPLSLPVPSPACVQIEITDHCIVKRCLGCSRGAKLNKQTMEIVMFQKLLRELFQLGTRSIVLSGGEPLTHPHIQELLKFAADLDMSVAVLTDGLAIATEEGLADVLGATVTSLRISVDGFTPESYRKIRHLEPGEGDPIKRVENGLSLLAEAKRKPDAKLEHIGVCVTLFRSNVGEIEAARRWAAKQNSVDSLVFKFAHGSPRTVQDSAPFACSASDVGTARDAINSNLDNRGQNQKGNARYVSTYVDSMGEEAIASGEPTAHIYDKEGAVCFTPLLFSLVDPSGGVYICCHTYYDNSSEHENRKKLLFGNIAREPFGKIWHKTALKRISRIHEWNSERGALQCTCPMRKECTRHWKHNQLLTASFDGYRKASLTGRQTIADEIQQFADPRAQPFWL